MPTTPEWGAPVVPATAALLVAYREELLRWNRQINLLSRRDPEGTADHLIRQCTAAFAGWWAASGEALVGGAPRWEGGARPGPALRMFDLGSGGGLPAFVWLALLAERGVAVCATLVEPRQKRAWFLERLRELPGAPAFGVAATTWGPRAAVTAASTVEAAVEATGAAGAAAGAAKGPEGATGAAPILFTIKALWLSEAEVLAPLAAVAEGAPLAPGRRVEIVRFQPGVGVDVGRLARELSIPAAGAAVVGLEGMRFAAEGCAYLAAAPEPASSATFGQAGAAGLLVSRHRVVDG